MKKILSEIECGNRPERGFSATSRYQSSGGEINTPIETKEFVELGPIVAKIEIKGLSKTFGSNYALKGVNLSVDKGQYLTIFGPNGAGKTTLIRIVSTLTTASSGSVTIGGFSLDKEPESVRRQIGVIAHQTFLYEELTAEENLRFYGKLYDVPELSVRIDQVLAEVGLQHRRSDRVRAFSRGMQQRLSIARAMLHQPSVLLLDEPYTGLDQHAAEMLSDWLKRLRSKSRTILMVTHDLERGIEMADTVAILNKGQIAFYADRAAIDASTFRNTYYEIVARKIH